MSGQRRPGVVTRLWMIAAQASLASYWNRICADWDSILECAPGGGRVAFRDLTGQAGLSGEESHGEAQAPLDCVQAASCPGVHWWRDLAWPREASRCFAQSDPDLGAEV